MKLALIGFGVVGQGLAEILHSQAGHLHTSQHFAARIVAVATRSRGTLCHPDGLDIPQLLTAAQNGSLDHYPDTPGLQRGLDVLQIIRESSADVLVEASVSDLISGQPAIDYCRAALNAGKHLVLANKGPVALAYAELQALARQRGRLLRFESTVMAGTPSLELALGPLAGCRIHSARGILNGTSNYILTRMEQGLSYTEALHEAQQLGYAEADPTADVEGWDAAGKVLILAAALFGAKLTMQDLSVSGISSLTPEDIRTAHAAGQRWKLIAEVTAEGGSVRPLRLPADDPLAGVSGVTNAITYQTDLLGAVTLVGPGAGRIATGYGLLADLLAIHRLNGFT